ncbi:MAG: hypothetical protein C5B47_06240 [Verrucomicrobia bacterium]|nr:MAG: hypothetical protein C5B47_06240 [Verrucomicrobiota bacterium]
MDKFRRGDWDVSKNWSAGVPAAPFVATPAPSSGIGSQYMAHPYKIITYLDGIFSSGAGGVNFGI